PGCYREYSHEDTFLSRAPGIRYLSLVHAWRKRSTGPGCRTFHARWRDREARTPSEPPDWPDRSAWYLNRLLPGGSRQSRNLGRDQLLVYREEELPGTGL